MPVVLGLGGRTGVGNGDPDIQTRIRGNHVRTGTGPPALPPQDPPQVSTCPAVQGEGSPLWGASLLLELQQGPWWLRRALPGVLIPTERPSVTALSRQHQHVSGSPCCLMKY